jgi:1-phosphofructokinase
VALDASGPALTAGLRADPDLAKPNRAELAEWCGEPLDSLAAVAGAGRRLLASGTGLAVVSLGADGALFMDRERTLLAHPPAVDLLSTVGAGDAMVAGTVAARVQGLPLDQTARLATAFSAAKLARLGPHLPAPATVRSLADTVRLTLLP